MPSLAPLPNAVLAAVVAISVHRLIANGISEIAFLWRVSRIELVEFMAALIAPLVVGLEIGIFIAIGCSILIHLLRHSFADIVRLGPIETTGQSTNRRYVALSQYGDAQVVIMELSAEISFSNSRRLVDGVRALLVEGTRFIVVSMASTQIIDTTSLAQIESLFAETKGSYIAFTECRPSVVAMIKRFESKKQAFPSNVMLFGSTDDAVLYFEGMIRGNVCPKEMDREDPSIGITVD